MSRPPFPQTRSFVTVQCSLSTSRPPLQCLIHMCAVIAVYLCLSGGDLPAAVPIPVLYSRLVHRRRIQISASVHGTQLDLLRGSTRQKYCLRKTGLSVCTSVFAASFSSHTTANRKVSCVILCSISHASFIAFNFKQ